MNTIPIIDTHFHIWNTNHVTLEWLEAFSSLKKIYTLEDYDVAMKSQNLTKSCYTEVDVIKGDLTKESDYIVGVCKDKSNLVTALTLGGDLFRNDFSAYIHKYHKTGYVKSVRHNFFACDPDSITEAIFIQNTKLLGKLNLMFNLTMLADFMPFGLKLVQQCPETRFIIDHCGFYPMKGNPELIQQWRKGISKYAAEKNTICKISEFCFTRPEYKWKIEDVVSVIKHCADSFGDDRIIYGSNWPVCEITGSVDLWFDALNEAFKNKPQSFWHKLLHQNAELYYEI